MVKFPWKIGIILSHLCAGAYDATDLVAKLRSYHHSAQQNNAKEFMWAGLDLEKGTK
jgi:hypothetical protein